MAQGLAHGKPLVYKLIFIFSTSSWSSGKGTELLACKIKFPEMRSTERWGGEREGGGRCWEDSCFVLFTNPSLASIVRSCFLLSGCSRTPCISTGEVIFLCLLSLPLALLPSLALLPVPSPSQILTSALWSSISFFVPSIPKCFHAKVCVDIGYPTPSLTTSSPFSSPFYLPPAASTGLLKNEPRQVRKPGHCDTQKIPL